MSLIFPGGSSESNPVFLKLAVAVSVSNGLFVALQQTGEPLFARRGRSETELRPGPSRTNSRPQ